MDYSDFHLDISEARPKAAKKLKFDETYEVIAIIWCIFSHTLIVSY